jgi:hypothetical protein
MPVQTLGATLSTQVSFNQGTLQINGVVLAQLSEVTITQDTSTKELRSLGSILMQTAPKRYGYKCGAKFKVHSANKELFTFFMGSSNTDGSGQDFTVFDGQVVLANVYINMTMNEDPTKIEQFQFTNAVLAGNFQMALKAEDFAESDFELQAQNVTVVTSF